MKNTKKKLFSLIIGVIVVLTITFPAFAQEKKIVKCKVKDKKLKSVKYYIGFIDQGIKPDDSLLVHIAVKANQVNESDLVLIARHLKERFCKETRLVVLIFDSKITADNFDTTFKAARDALRGEYVLDKEKGKEYISFIKIPNYFENTKDAIKIDLSSKVKDKITKPK